MAALQIRDVPDEVRQALAGRAAAAGRSLQSFLLALVTEEARRAGNLTLLQRFSGRDDGSRLGAEEVQQSVDDDRRQRESDLRADPSDR